MSSERCSAVLVEIEGVLADTRAARRAALAAALGPLGIALQERVLAHAADGRASAEAVAAAARIEGLPRLDATDLELAVLRAERAFVDAMAHSIALVPDARDALAALAAHVPVGVVTRLPRAVADAVLSFAALEPHVRFVIGAAPGEPVTASSYQRALDRLARSGPPAGAAVVAIVDTAGGAEAARGAGLRVIGVGRGAGDATTGAGWLASDAVPTYDALMQTLACNGVRAS